jgi:branched-chain amino acid transport system substrate-binding protein
MLRRMGRTLLAIVAVGSGLATACGGGASSSSSPLKIGILAPFSGIYTIAGKPIQDGVQLWLDQHGNRIGGRPVQVFVGDDQSTVDGELSAAKALVERDGVQDVVGLVNSAGALAVRDYLTRNKIVTMSVVANATELLDPRKGPYLFMINPPANETAAAAAVLMQQQGWHSVVGIADNYVGARTWLDPSLDAAHSLGIDVLKRVYPPFPTSDYGPYLTALRSVGAFDAVCPVMFGPDALAFLKQYHSFGLTQPVYTTGSMLEPTSVSLDLLSAAQGASVYWNYSPWLATAANDQFRKAFQARFHRLPGGFEMQSYTAMELFDQGYRSAGAGGGPDALRRALTTVSVSSPVGQVALGTSQAASWDIYLTRVGKGPDGTMALLPAGPYVAQAHPGMTLEQAKAALKTLGR